MTSILGAQLESCTQH